MIKCGFCGQPMPTKLQDRLLHNGGACCRDERQRSIDAAGIPKDRQCVAPRAVDPFETGDEQ